MPDVRALNDPGISEFQAYLARLKEQPTLAPPTELLSDLRYTELVTGGVAVDHYNFATKFEFGNYAWARFRDRIPKRILRNSVGLWAWLALFYFDQVCPLDGHGRRKVLRAEKYLPSHAHIATGLEKHLLFFPWKMVASHGDDAQWLLNCPLPQDNKVVRELANSYRRNVSTEFLRVAKTLYFDTEAGRVRKGATTTSRPGNLRRLDRVFHQLDLTYDIFGLSSHELARLLPRREFNRWLPRGIQLAAAS